MHAAGLPLGGIDGIDERIEHTHVAVAAAVAAGLADVGLGVEAAAREFGLAFAPLVEEDYFFVCLKPALESPAVQRLRRVLALPRWAEALTGLPGYRVQRAGEVLALTRALPWWDFKRPRRRVRAAAPKAQAAPLAAG
jgi:putative molybdopterin biosynthesis protein